MQIYRHSARVHFSTWGGLALAAVWIATAVSAQPEAPLPVEGDESKSAVGTFPHTESPEVPERFQFDELAIPWRRSTPRTFSSFETFRLTFPSSVVTDYACNNTVHCEYFAPTPENYDAGNPLPAVVVLHILGGDFELSRICCRTFASSGVAALFVKLPFYGPRRPPGSRERMISPDPDKSVRRVTQAIKDIRLAVDWLVARPEVDRDRIGITGISLGGIVASLAASVEPRFASGCFVLAGADFPKIVAHSTEMDDIRAAWRGRPVTAEEVGAMLNPIDPLTYAKRLRGRRMLMMNARNDRVIPRACADALWEAAGKPERIWWNAGHYTAAAFLPSALARLVTFFNE